MNCNEDQSKTLINTINGNLGLQVVSEQELHSRVMAFAPVVAADLCSDCLEAVIKAIQASRGVLIDIGEVLADKHVPWLDARRAEIDFKRWNAYSKMLAAKGLEPQVIDAIHRRQDMILDLAGDPSNQGSWARRGLVIGDVQSGKTANYLALFNKAADAGYRAIILLAGHTDKLRKQTQARVDEGFVGRDSRLLGQGLQQLQPNTVGVGKLGVTATPFTTYNSDFSTAQVAGNNIDVQALNSPVIFVIKKNKRIIDNLVQWLASQVSKDGKLKTPMLLLDDEADFASINTSKNPAEATAINQGIQDLLARFEKNSYVGFTATPFANVLIDDEQPEDLFPRDFIFCLDSPSNYFGPDRMAALDDDDDDFESNPFIHPLTDAEAIFPFKHKRTLPVTKLPESLVEAIRSFFLVNAIRDLRGQEKKPRSMLINVSRFVDVQASVFDLVNHKVSALRNALKFDSNLTGGEWKALEALFAAEFKDSGLTWSKVKKQVLSAIDAIEVHVVNSKNSAEAWDAVYATDKARVIAIGGDVLSRGLTLEGLSTSYFYRRSLAYDTLMQMGRWFGYREGYDDLCRLWIDKEVASWYIFIADATADLRNDLKDMRIAGLTPKEFGLAIRKHPGSMLTVTALNKSRSGLSVNMKISLMNSSLETARLPLAMKSNESNWEEALKFISKLREEGYSSEFKRARSETWSGVPKTEVANFLSKFNSAESDPYFGSTLATFIATAKSAILQDWDIALISGSGKVLPEANAKHKQSARKIYSKGDVLYVGGNKMRLGGRSDLAICMSAKQEALIEEYKSTYKKEAPASAYRAIMERPLMLLYFMEPKPHETNADAVAPMQPYEPQDLEIPLVGVHLSFPRGTGSVAERETVTFLVNKVWQRFNDSMAEFDITDSENDDQEPLEE
jgi:hypothetical protein